MSKKNYIFEILAKRGTTSVKKPFPVMAETAADALKKARESFRGNSAYKGFIIDSIKNITKK